MTFFKGPCILADSRACIPMWLTSSNVDMTLVCLDMGPSIANRWWEKLWIFFFFSLQGSDSDFQSAKMEILINILYLNIDGTMMSSWSKGTSTDSGGTSCLQVGKQLRSTLREQPATICLLLHLRLHS